MTDEKEIMERMKEDRRKAEEYILWYEKHLKEYRTRKEEYLTKNPGMKVGSAKGSGGSQVEAAAIQSAEYDRRNREYTWLRAVDIVLRSISEHKRLLVKVRREAEKKNQHPGRHIPGRKGWIIFVQRRYSEELNKIKPNAENWFGETTIKTWWKSILDKVVEVHLRIEKR